MELIRRTLLERKYILAGKFDSGEGKKMKWINKGHEFDDRLKKIFQGKRLYIYGAGANGKRLYNKMFYLHDKIDGFIDRNKFAVDFIKVISYGEIDYDIIQNSIVIIATEGEIASHMWLQLTALGFSRDSIFYYREWEKYYLDIYALFEKGIVVSQFISLQFSNICNCKCEYCLAFTPELESCKYFGLDMFQKNADAIFRNIDYVDMLDLSGGEPFLIEEFAKCIDYIGGKYRERIGVLRTITNATVIPSDEICEAMKKNAVWVWIDDYRGTDIGKRICIEDIVKKFDKYGIAYGIREAEYWINLGIKEKERSTDIEAEYRYNECLNKSKSMHNLRLYGCCYAGFANEAKVYCGNESDYIYLGMEERIDKAVMLEFLLGYTEKGFLGMCRKCYGSETINNHYIPVAQQMKR